MIKENESYKSHFPHRGLDRTKGDAQYIREIKEIYRSRLYLPDNINEHIDKSSKTHQMFIIECKVYPIELVQKEINCKPNPIELVQRDKPDFSDLYLREEGWKIDHALTPEQKEFMKENVKEYKDYKENILYKGPQGFAILQANYKKDRHKLDIYINHYNDGALDTMEIVKSIFERGWRYKLQLPKELDLIGKSKDQKANESDLIKLLGY